MEAWELRDQTYLRYFAAARVDFLKKPFLPEALREKVRELLGSGRIGK